MKRSIFGVTGDIFDQKLRTARAQVDAVAVFAAAVKIQVVQMGFFRHSEAEGPAAGLDDLQIADFNIFHPGKVKEMPPHYRSGIPYQRRIPCGYIGFDDLYWDCLSNKL